MYLDDYRPIYFKLGMLIKIVKLYILIPVWMTVTFIQGRSGIGNDSVSIFMQIPQLMQGRELSVILCFIKYTVSIGLCWDTS